MAPRYRSLHDPAVSSYLDDITTAPSQPLPSPAQAGAQAHDAALESAVASANKVKFSSPRAQSLARGVIGDTAREAEYQQRDRARAQEQAARENERSQAAMAKAEADAAEANRAMNVRAGAAAGMKTETDIVTGKRSIATHPDGAPVWKAGPQGDPIEIGQQSSAVNVPGEAQPTTRPFVNPLIGDDGGALGATGGTTQAAFGQKVRDDRGNTRMVQPDTTTDAKTGRQYVSKTDPTTGATVKTAVGIDQAKYQQIQRDRQYQAKAQEIALRDNAIKQQRFRFDPAFKPVATEFEAATKEIEALPPVFTKQGGIWRYTDPKTLKEVTTYDPREVERQKTLRENAEKRHARAKEAFDKMAPNAGRLDKAEQQIREAKLKLESDKLHMDAGLPQEDGGVAKILARAQAGEEVYQDEVDAAMMTALGIDPRLWKFEDESGQATPRQYPEIPTNQEASTDPGEITEERPLIPDDPDMAKLFADQFQGLVNPEEFTLGTTGQGHAFIKRKTKYGEGIVAKIVTESYGGKAYKRPLIVLSGTVAQHGDLKQIIAFGGTKGIDIYLEGTGRPNPVKEAEWTAGVFQSVKQAQEAQQTPEQLDKMLKEAGADQLSIFRKVRKGELSVQRGEAIMRDLYGTTLKAEDPLAPGAMEKYMTEEAPADLRKRYETAKRNRDTAGMNAVGKEYINNWFLSERMKPGVNLASKIIAEKALVKERRGGEKVAEIGAAAGEMGASSAGMMAALHGIHNAELVYDATTIGGEKAYEKLKLKSELVGRGWKNTNRSWNYNRKRWLTDEGKSRHAAYVDAGGKLRSHIAVQDNYVDGVEDPGFQSDFAEHVEQTIDAAMKLHEMGLEEGWEIKREDLEKLNWMPAMAALSGDMELLDQWRNLLTEDHGTRQAMAMTEELTRGQNRYLAAFTAGSVAPPQEILVEAASYALTVGVGKVIYGGAKTAQIAEKAARIGRSATRIQKLRAAAHGVKDGYAKLGMRPDTLAAPASQLGKASNQVVKGLKVSAAGAVTNAPQEGAMAMADRNATAHSVAHDFLAGGAFGAVMPILAAPSIALSNINKERARKKAAVQYADHYNRTNRDTEGFVPLTPQNAEVAMALVPDETRAKLIDNYKTTHDAFLRAAELSAKYPDNTSAQNNFSRAQSAFMEAADAQATSAARHTEAVKAIEATDPAERDFASAVAKVASGRPELLTTAERSAAAGVQTADGKPYFADVNGKEVVTDDGRADALDRFPEVAALIQTTESQALLEAEAAAETITQPGTASGAQGDPATGGSSVPPLVSDASGQGVQPSPEPAPTGAPNLAELDAAEYQMARAENPAMPEIGAAVSDAVAQGRPVSVSMAKAAGIDTPEGYTRRGATLVPPQGQNTPTPGPVENPATTGETAPESADKAKTRPAKESASAAIARAETVYPKLKGRFVMDAVGKPMDSGGAYMLNGKVVINLRDTAADLDGYMGTDEQNARLDAVLDEEIVHIAQLEAAAKQGERLDTFYQSLYDDFTPEQLAAAENTYATIDKETKEKTDRPKTAWEKLLPWQKAAETTRMLIQLRADGKTTELTKAFSKNMPQKLIDILREAVAILREMMEGGQVSQRITDTIEGIEAMLAEFKGETAPTTATSDGKSIESDTNAAETPMQSVGKAITRALAKYPAIGKDRASRDGLFDLTDELMEVTAPLTPAERAAYIDSAFEEYAQGLKETAQEEVQAEEAGKSDEKRQKARNARMERESRIRDKARTILNSGNYSALSSVFERGKIQRKPNAIGLILARKRSGKKLTELEMGQLRNLSEWDGAPTKSEWKGGGNNEIIRAILDILYAKPGEGLMPDQIADGLIPGVDTSSEMFEAIDKELRALSRGESLIDRNSPEFEGDEESIAAADAAAKAALEAEEAAQAPLPSLPEVIASLRETYGEDMDLAAKLDLAQQVIAQLPKPMQTAITQAAMEEEQRIAYGVISAAKWQEMNPGLSTPAKWFQRLLDNQNTDSIRATLNKLRNPKVQEEFAAMSLASSPSGLSIREIQKAMAKYPGASLRENPITPSGTRYEPFRLRPDGVTLYLKSRSGALFPDGHEVKITQTAPSSVPDGGGAFWNRLRDGGRRNALQNAARDNREDPKSVAWFTQRILKGEPEGRRGSVPDFWNWLRDKLNSKAFDGLLPEDTHDALAAIIGLETPVVENGEAWIYTPIDSKGTVLISDTRNHRFEFGRLPTAAEMADAKEASETGGYALFSSPSTGFFDFGATGEMGTKTQMGLNFDGPRAKAKENAQAAFDKAPEGSPARERIATQIARREGLADPAEFVKQAVKTATPETSSTEGSPAEAGYEYNPRNKYDGVLPETFRYTVANDIKIPEGSQVIASIIYERKIGRNHPLYRISIIENAEGGRYAMVEKGSDIQGGFGGALTSFDRLDEYDDRQYAAVNDRARKLFEEHPKDQLGLFSSPSQRAFDFGTSGSFSTRNQAGFDFGDSKATPERTQSAPKSPQTLEPQGKKKDIPKDTSHLDALELGLSRERERLRNAKTEKEKRQREVWVGQMEREVAAEREFLGLPPATEATAQSDQELLDALLGDDTPTTNIAGDAARPKSSTATSATAQLWDWASDNFSSKPGAAQPNLFDNQPPTKETTPNDLPSSTNLEPDRPRAGTGDASRTDRVPVRPGATGGTGRRVDESGEIGGDTGQGGPLSAAVPSAPAGIESDSGVQGSAPEPERGDTGDSGSTGRGEPDAGGVSPERPGRDDVRENLVLSPSGGGTVARGRTADTRTQQSSRRDGWVTPLTPDQQGDVAFAKRRLYEKGKEGVLLTNGTGTGKTFSGLGIIKDALDSGAKHILVVAPSDKVGSDWTATAQDFFDIPDIAQLQDTKDNGTGNRIAVTTYANLGQNDSLVNRPWDMIVTDEAHYLSQSKEGKSTNALERFRALTWHKDGLRERAEMVLYGSLRAELTAINAIPAKQRTELQNTRRDAIYRIIDENYKKLKTEREAIASTPKAVMLSATPFAYHFSLDYAEGYIFEHGKEPESKGYNTPSARDRFFVENFGYRMKYGKLTIPDAAAATATGILERRFAEKLMKDGAMSGRALKVDRDYSRQFALTESEIGTRIDEIMTFIQNNERFHPLKEFIGLGNYLARRYLLEGIKARESVKRIKQHLALGRKVVVFHDYKKGGAMNPLTPSIYEGQKKEYRQEDGSMKEINLSALYEEMKRALPIYEPTRIQLNGLASPIDVFTREFPGIAEIFNGSVGKAKRRALVKRFNGSDSGLDILLVQRASGKEGISLHDIDGKRQRAFIDIGMPARPTDAIQGEGRIYRHGVKSDAVIEYLTTGTNVERWTFAQTIAQRSSTAENLAMGEAARALLQAYATGYNDAENFAPNMEQGKGGKEMDKAREESNPYQNAIALYFTNQKKTSRNKSAEGSDYFATPEPLGFKMVEWADIQPGEKVLEPSGGHGAIARFFPDSTNRHAVEASNELAGKLALNATDTAIHNMRFEDYNIANKFNAVVMNPPFGTAGKTAMDHLVKALGHLRNGGRAVALIPQGSSMEKRFDKWYESKESDGFYMRGSIALPSVTFERAGTAVSARIIIIDKIVPQKGRETPSLESRNIDLSGIGTTKELFERLENITMFQREDVGVQPPEETDAAEAAEEVTTGAALIAGGRGAMLAKVPKPETEGTWASAEFNHTKTGNPIFVVKIMRNLSREEYLAAQAQVKTLGGRYSNFKGAGAIPGFHFDSAEARDAFIGGGASDSGMSLASSPSPQQPDAPIVLWGRKPSMGNEWMRLTDNISKAEVARREKDGWEVLKHPQNSNPGDIEKAPQRSNPTTEQSSAVQTTQPDLFTAATAPDAPKKLGDVKVGRMHALTAYRSLTAKRGAGKALTATEEQQLLDAEVALGQKLAFDMEGMKAEVIPQPPTAVTRKPAKPQADTDTETLFGSDNSFKVDREGQMRLFSSPAPGSFRADLISAFSKPTNQHTYEYTDERREKIVTALNKHGLRSVSSPELELATRRFESATGTAVVYYRGGEKEIGGFTSPDFADVILINADSPRILANTLAHELAHAAQKDKATDTDGLLADTVALLSESELDELQQKLLPFYPENQASNEIMAYLMGDSITGVDHLGLNDLRNAERIKELYRAFFDSMGVLNPSGLKEVSDDELLGLKSSPTPEDSEAIQAALSSMRPIYRKVFEAVSSGMTPEQVMAKFSLSEKAVVNILGAVKSRIEVAVRASKDTLKPEMKDGKFVNNRPDLAEGAKPDFAAIDQIRNDNEIPGSVSRDENYAEADRILAGDYEGQIERIIALHRNGKTPTAVDVAVAKTIIRRETLSTGLADPERRARIAMLRMTYRDLGTDQSRAFSMRQDESMTLAERNAASLADLMMEPPDDVRKRYNEAKDEATRKAIMKQWMDRIDAFKKQLLAEGIDLDKSLALFNQRLEARKQAEADNARTKAAIDGEIRKLSKIEKTVVESILDGAKMSTVQTATGIEKAEILRIHRSFDEGIRAAIAAAAKRFMASSLGSSPTGDPVAAILADLGWQSLDDFDDTAPDYKEKQETKERVRKAAETKPRKTKAEEMLGVGTKELTDKQKAAIERFVNAPPSTWKAIRQETAALFPEAKGFPEGYEAGENARRILSGMLMPEDINEATGTWDETRPFTGQGELIREPINETTGTFDMNDPVAVANVMNAAGRGGLGLSTKLIEWYKMAILSGIQTMMVNTMGGLHIGYLLGPQRALEAGWNDILGLFGAGDARSATFGEFIPMFRNFRASMQLAARNALRAWELENPVFEQYAEAKPIQLDFDGKSTEFSPPPSLHMASLKQLADDPSFRNMIGVVNRFMRNITFRELTAVDEFWKGMFSQLDAAALAHRIAAKEEKLKGDAYTERVQELMKQGSLAWKRTTPRTKKATFQDLMEYGKFTPEDEKRNPAHRAGTQMTWKQALKKSETQSAFTALDALAAVALDARNLPFVGPLLHMFALPFINTPKNLIQRGLEVSPIGLAVDIIDGMRSLKRRLYSGKLTKEESMMIAAELYNRTRFVQTLTNQTMAIMAYLAIESMVGEDDEDELGRPILTGTVPFSGTKRGERENIQVVMPAQSIRIGNVIIGYGRLDPFSTAIATLADIAHATRRQGGYNAAAVTDVIIGMKDQFKEKLFFKGLGDIIKVVEDPTRGADRLAAGYIASMVPNIVRQPIREIDPVVRDRNPRAEAGMFEAIATRVGYNLVPQLAPEMLDIWGEPIRTHRGEDLGGSRALDAAFRIFDPTNTRFGTDAKPIEVWMYHYNYSQPDSALRIGIEAYGDEVQVRVPGEIKPRQIPLTQEERAEAQRNIGRQALAILGEDWNWRKATGPEAEMRAEYIKKTFSQLRAIETARLKAKKFGEIMGARK